MLFVIIKQNVWYFRVKSRLKNTAAPQGNEKSVVLQMSYQICPPWNSDLLATQHPASGSHSPADNFTCFQVTPNKHLCSLTFPQKLSVFLNCILSAYCEFAMYNSSQYIVILLLIFYLLILIYFESKHHTACSMLL